MLLQITINNFKSIKDEITLDLRASNKLETDETIFKKAKENVLPIATIRGVNGAGKSNIIEAIGAITSLIKTPIDLANRKGYIETAEKCTPFKFDEDKSTSPTTFDIIFTKGKNIYRYLAKVKDDAFVEESLFKKGDINKEFSNIFIRKQNHVDCFYSLKGLNLDDIPPDFSTIAYLIINYDSIPLIEEVYSFFDKLLVFRKTDWGYKPLWYYENYKNKEKVNRFIIDTLNNLDFDIYDYDVIRTFRLKTIECYRMVDGKDCTTYLEEESQGIQKIFGLLPLIHQTLLNGGVLFIDDIDKNFHSSVSSYLIKLFLNKETNRKGGQLITSCYDLVCPEYYRKDEILNVSKDNNLITHLSSSINY